MLSRFCSTHFREPEVAGVTFSDSDFAPVSNFCFWIRVRLGEFFKFDNRTPVQNPATIDPTGNLPMFLLEKRPRKNSAIPKQ